MGLYFVNKATDGQFGVLLVLVKDVENVDIMAFMPKYPIIQNGYDVKYPKWNENAKVGLDNPYDKISKILA